MAFIETTPPSAAEGEVREMYARQERSWGFVPNYAKVFCHRPELMTRWASLLSGIKKNLDPARFELVTTAAARALGSTCCSLAHGAALSEHLPPEAVSALMRDPGTTALSEADRAIVRLATLVVTDPSAVTPDDVQALKAHGLTDADVFDVVAAAAARAFFAGLIEALGVRADAPWLELDEELRNSLTVGRPICTDPPEHVPDKEP